MEELLHNTTVWVAISFMIFVALAVKLAGGKVLGELDKKIASIKAEIETAQRLKAEAQALLADYENRQRDAEKEAAALLASAKAQAKDIMARAERDLQEAIVRREQSLSDRIRRVEEGAVAEIRARAAELAVNATREIINRSLDEKAAVRLADDSMNTISKHLN